VLLGAVFLTVCLFVSGCYFFVKFFLRIFPWTVYTGNVCSLGKYCCKYQNVFLQLTYIKLTN